MTFYVLKISGMNTNAHFRAIIFDIDGTLFDTLPSLVAAANSVLIQAGLHEVATPPLRAALNEGLLPMFRRAISLQTGAVKPEIACQLEKDFISHYSQQWLTAAPAYPHVQEALLALKTRYIRLGVCTNRDRASTEILLANAGITDFFDTIVGMGDAPHPKPAADPLLLVLERMGLLPKDALFVGDSSMDASCAQLSQVQFAAHLGGYAVQAHDLWPNILSFNTYPAFTSWVIDCLTANKDAAHA